MTIIESIKKAFEGGYKMLGFANKPLFSWSIDKYWGGFLVCVRYGAFGQESVDKTKHIEDKYNDFDIAKIFLDPLFWQALGKAMGWKYCRFHSITGSENDAEMCDDCKHDQWLKEWHRFMDTLAEGGTAEDYFKTL